VAGAAVNCFVSVASAAVNFMKAQEYFFGQYDAAVVFTVTNRQARHPMFCTAVAGESSKSGIACHVVLFRRGAAFWALQVIIKVQLWLCTRGWALQTVWTFGDEKNLSALLLSCRHHRVQGQTASSFTLSILPLTVIQSRDPIHLAVLLALLLICMYAQINLVFVHLLFA
jgi:hypothetical protein